MKLHHIIIALALLTAALFCAYVVYPIYWDITHVQNMEER